VAQGVVQATRETQLGIPLVVRLAGTNVEEGRKILKDSGLPIITADTLSEAADRVVQALNASRAGQSPARARGKGPGPGSRDVAGGNGHS
jgi:malate-CoA ligase subunit beta